MIRYRMGYTENPDRNKYSILFLESVSSPNSIHQFVASSNFPSSVSQFTQPIDMAEITELSDWELLPSSAPDPSAIKSDYFSLPPSDPIPSSSEEEGTDEGGIDSDNPSSHGETGPDPILEASFQGIEYGDPNSGQGEIDRHVEGVKEEDSEEIEEKNGSIEKKRGSVWELPWEIVKYCVSKMKPTWYFTLAGAILGLAWIGKRMYRIREKKRSEFARASMDGKRITKLAVRAVHVNEALKHVPILRTAPLAGGTIPGSLLALR